MCCENSGGDQKKLLDPWNYSSWEPSIGVPEMELKYSGRAASILNLRTNALGLFVG